MTHFILRWQRGRGHIHARLFTAKHEAETHANCGQLTFVDSEWEAFLRCFQDRGEDTILVVPDDSERS